MTNASSSTFIGAQSGELSVGGQNTYVGRAAGQFNATGSNNTFVGYQAGVISPSSSSVFLGSFSGANEAFSNRLYIENSNSSAPLIYGEFDNDIVGINGTLGVGTQLPTSTLHVRRADSSARVLVEETNLSGPLEMFELRSTGAGRPRFAVNNTSALGGAGAKWTFDVLFHCCPVNGY
jgi:hypothetical protein